MAPAPKGILRVEDALLFFTAMYDPDPQRRVYQISLKPGRDIS